MKSLVLLLGLLCLPAYAQSAAPFNRYLATVLAGREDARFAAFAHTCVSSEIKPARKFFYTEQSDWLPAKSLGFAFAGYVTGDANTAEVMEYAGVARAVYLWEVDLEYQRDTLFCLSREGEVTRAISRFFPSESGEPREHWVYVRTVRPGPRANTWMSLGAYQDSAGKHLDRPELSSEDRDFIAGERSYHYWKDFDFAELTAISSEQKSAEKDSHATP